MRDEADLMRLADALAENSEIDWDEAAARAADDAARSLIRELRLIAGIAAHSQDAVVSPSDRSMPAEGPEAAQWGHLTLHEQIGKGSFGDVYRAWDTHLERDVAVKILPLSAASTGSIKSRALKEARLLARIRHQNVVTVHGVDCHDGVFGLWMELIKGRTLDAILKFHGPMGAREASLIGIDLCHALAAVHRAGLLHRDIKSANVMREDGGRVVLMDFGAGRLMSTGDGGVLAGTPLYMAPELFKGSKPSITSDTYSLGVLLYHLVTGAYPIEAETRDAVIEAHQQGRRKLLRDTRPDLPTPFVSVVERALCPHPKDRFQSAGALGEAIAASSGLPYSADPSPSFGWRRWWTPAAAVVLTAIVAAVGIPLLNRSNVEDGRSDTLPTTATPVSPTASASPAGTYQIAANFYAERDGKSHPLAADSRVVPGDRIFMTLDLSAPAYVYVINQDDAGEAYVLFPLPGQEPINPLAPSRTNRLPGPRDNEEFFWQVTSAGGREHFLLFASPERMTPFEQVLAALPRAEEGRPVIAVQLPKDALETLRGVGGITKSVQAGALDLGGLPRLSPNSETAKGLWARQITFQNPKK